VSDQVWAFWDVLPTLADIAGAGVKPPAGIDGISMLPTLLGRAGAQKSHEYLYWEFFERGFQQAIRYGDWKGIKLGAGKPLALYNLARDLKESHDVAGDFPDIVSQINKLLAGARTESALWPTNP
jgi:arylsulfatase A